MDKKPGTTRLAFIVIGSALFIFLFVVGLYAWRVDSGGLKDIALMFAGALVGMTATILATHFPKET